LVISSLQPNPATTTSFTLQPNGSQTISLGVIPVGGFYMLQGSSTSEENIFFIGVILYNHNGKVMKFNILGNDMVGLSVPVGYNTPYTSLHSKRLSWFSK
jgi:hypothetical protein